MESEQGLSEKDKWVGNAVAQLEGKGLYEVARAYVELRERLDYVSEEKARLEALKGWFDKNRLPKMMEEAKLESFKLKDGGTLRLQPDVYVSLPAEAKEAVFKWFREAGMAGMITETINAGTLAAYVRESLREGHRLPIEEGLKINPYTKVVYKK